MEYEGAGWGEQQEPGARVPAEGEGVAGGQKVTVSSAGTSYRKEEVDTV